MLMVRDQYIQELVAEFLTAFWKMTIKTITLLMPNCFSSILTSVSESHSSSHSPEVIFTLIDIFIPFAR